MSTNFYFLTLKSLFIIIIRIGMDYNTNVQLQTKNTRYILLLLS